MTLPSKADVLVVGGGPAGSTAAGQLAAQGYDVVLIDKQQHPRETVGESILPSAWKYFDLVGATPAVDACRIVLGSLPISAGVVGAVATFKMQVLGSI